MPDRPKQPKTIWDPKDTAAIKKMIKEGDPRLRNEPAMMELFPNKSWMQIWDKIRFAKRHVR